MAMNLKKRASSYMVETTAALAESNPWYSLLEVTVADMSDDVSLHARLVATGISYAGLGYFFTQTRALSRRLMHITDHTAERWHLLHDAAYTAMFNVTLAPIMYYIAGAHDPREIAIGTAVATAIGAVNGSPMGYAVDIFNDLFGLQPCERKSYPSLLRTQPPRVKKAIAVGCIAASIGTMAAIYAATPDEAQTLEQRVEK